MQIDPAVLAILRCPVTRQELRYATSEEKHQHNLPDQEPALITLDGARIYGSQNGILLLVPETKPENAAGS